jgi:ElaB/YqjD/DUF883 family membrane-anchored ribosome-binding protein
MSFPDNDDDFVEDEPLSAPMQRSRASRSARTRLRGAGRRVSTGAGDTWKKTKAKAGAASQHTQLFLRENPVPTILGALALGLAIGFAIRYASSSDERKESELKSPLGTFNWSFLSLPFLWPFFKSIQGKYEDSAAAVRSGVDHLKKIDIDDYAKPIRKRWKSWTH